MRGIAEGVEDVGKGDDSFEMAEVAAADDGEDWPIAGEAEGLFEGLIAEEDGQGALRIGLRGDREFGGISGEAVQFVAGEEAPFAAAGTEEEGAIGLGFGAQAKIEKPKAARWSELRGGGSGRRQSGTEAPHSTKNGDANGVEGSASTVGRVECLPLRMGRDGPRGNDGADGAPGKTRNEMKMWEWIRASGAGLGRRIAGPRGRAEREQEIEREIEAHLSEEAKEREEMGAAPEEARYAAKRALGNATVVAEEIREIWSWGWVERFARDLKYGARALRKSPGFTAVAVLTLALGIGANTAIFSVLDALILKRLPFPSADRIVRILSTKDARLILGYAYPGGPSAVDLADFARFSHTLERMALYDMWPKNVSFGNAGSEPQEMNVGLVPPGYFEILKMPPVLGRPFTEEEAKASPPPKVAAISARLWKSHFGSDSGILGRRILINDEPYTIVAVMPDVIPDWMERGVIEIWTPESFTEGLAEINRGSRGCAVLATLKPGVTLAQTQADLATIAANLAVEHPVDEGVGVVVQPLSDTRAGPMRPMLFLLMGAVGLILLIACANLANLLLARNSARQREMTLRAALGSGRRGLMQLLLAETLVVSLGGGAAGVLLAQAGLTTLAGIHPADLPQLGTIRLDGSVLAFTFAIALLTSLLFGLAPALTNSRVNIAEALKQGGRSGTPGRSSHRMRNVLVVSEMAMSLMLLVEAGLLTQSILRLRSQELGIRPEHLACAHLYMTPVHYPNPDAITRFCEQFAARVRGVPGVIDATIGTMAPPFNGWYQMLGFSGSAPTRIQDVPQAHFGVVDRHFLSTTGLPLLRGRDFADSDSASTAPVALISRELEKRYFPTRDPLGQRVHIGPAAFLNMPAGVDTTDSSDVTVIGITGDMRNGGLTLPPEPQIVVLYAQHPLVNYGFKDILFRTASDPEFVLPEIRRQLHEMDPNMPLAEVRTMDDIVARNIGGQRFTTALLELFAAAGLALAVVGIYGVVSYAVAQRTQEMAVRMALGASRGGIVKLVVGQGMRMAMTGATIGIAGAIAARRLTSGLLFGISAVDPLTIAAGTALLLAVGAMASAVPGMRAMRVELTKALRQE